MARYVIKFARRAVIVSLFVIAAFLGTASGILFAFAGDLPRISALDDYAPSTISRVYGARGEIVGEFAIHLAMREPGDKAFYTTPMKALSNQKFRELQDVYGPDEVGPDS